MAEDKKKLINDFVKDTLDKNSENSAMNTMNESSNVSSTESSDGNLMESPDDDNYLSLSDNVDLVIFEGRSGPERTNRLNFNSHHWAKNEENVASHDTGMPQLDKSLQDKRLSVDKNAVGNLDIIFQTKLSPCDTKLSLSSPCLLSDGENNRDVHKSGMMLLPGDGDLLKVKAVSMDLNKIVNRFDGSPVQDRRRQCYPLLTEGLIKVGFLSQKKGNCLEDLKFKSLKWQQHYLFLEDGDIKSAKATGYMETSIPYSCVEDVHIISRWDAGQKFCIRITIQEGSLLLQANNSHLRDQWLFSIQWKKHMYKYEKLLTNARRPEVLVKEIKNMIDVSLHTPIQDPSVYQFPLDLVSELLQRNADVITKVAHENIIVALAPLLENNHPTQEICDFFSKHCKNSPRSSIVIELFTPVVQRILKHNMDFGKFPRMRQFVQEYTQALNCQNAGLEVVKDFIRGMHSPASVCPHPRVLPNLVAVCLAAVYSLYEDKKLEKQDNNSSSLFDQSEWEKKVTCYVGMMETMSMFEDWRFILGSLLQPIPFPNDALADDLFTSNMKDVMRNIATDKVCDVHQTILGIREGKEGWFHLYCPGNIGCDDDGELWGQMLNTLMHCCCKRKNFLFGLNKMIGPVMLLSLRETISAMEVLCAMLECDVVENNDLKMQMVTTLQSTMSGKRMYADLCERQIALRELQEKGGPKKLTLPSKSTDSDLAKMLSSGSFGNLECLSLAFTQVTSACADDLIKLPSLRYLNLWSTQFGDVGLQKISEHLHKLQVLNLCETPVTDKGLSSIAALKHLRKLNLNSTNLSALVFEGLKEKLPALQECDVRYTEAWLFTTKNPNTKHRNIPYDLQGSI